MKLHVYCKTMDTLHGYDFRSGACQLVFTDGTELTMSSGSMQLGRLMQGYEEQEDDEEPEVDVPGSRPYPFHGHDLIYTVDEVGCLASFWSRDIWDECMTARGWPELAPGEEADVACPACVADGITVYRGVIDKIVPFGSRFMVYFKHGARAELCHRFAHTALAVSCGGETHGLPGADIVYSRSDSLNELDFFMRYSVWLATGGQAFEPADLLDLPPEVTADPRVYHAKITTVSAAKDRPIRIFLSNGCQLLLHGADCVSQLFESMRLVRPTRLADEPSVVFARRFMAVLGQLIDRELYYWPDEGENLEQKTQLSLGQIRFLSAEEWAEEGQPEIPLDTSEVMEE